LFLRGATGENQVQKHVKHPCKTLLYVRSSCVACILHESSVWITAEKDLFPCDVRILRFYSRICSVGSPCGFRAEKPLKVRKPGRVPSHKSRFRPVFIAFE